MEMFPPWQVLFIMQIVCGVVSALQLRSEQGQLLEERHMIANADTVYPDLPDCISRNLGFKDDEVQTKKVSNIRDCQARCRGDRRCKYYTYNKDRGECYMKTTGRREYSYPGDFSGSKDCLLTGSAGASMCILNDTGYEDESISTLKQNSFEECVNQCKTTEKCAGYTYDLVTKECQLKGSTSKTMRKPNQLSGPVECIVVGAGGVFTCIMAQIGIEDDSIAVVHSQTLEECASRCSTHVGKCVAYTYNYNEKKCYLKGSRDREAYSPNDFSGDVDCQPTGYMRCIKENTGLKDADIKVLTADSIDECQTACARVPACKAVTYNIYTRKCFMKATADKYYEYNGDYSPLVGCNLAEVIPCINFDYGYTATTLKTIAGISNMSGCRRECKNQENCRYYTYNVPTKQCFLKSSDSTGRAHFGDRSADVNCHLDGHPPCARGDWGIYGSDVEEKTFNSITDCADACRDEPKCKFYTYSLNRTCHLKEENSSARYFPGDVSSPKACSIF